LTTIVVFLREIQ